MSNDETFKVSARVLPALNKRIERLVITNDDIFNKTDFIQKALVRQCEYIESRRTWQQSVEARLYKLAELFILKATTPNIALDLDTFMEYMKEQRRKWFVQ